MRLANCPNNPLPGNSFIITNDLHMAIASFSVVINTFLLYYFVEGFFFGVALNVRDASKGNQHVPDQSVKVQLIPWNTSLPITRYESDLSFIPFLHMKRLVPVLIQPFLFLVRYYRDQDTGIVTVPPISDIPILTCSANSDLLGNSAQCRHLRMLRVEKYVLLATIVHTNNEAGEEEQENSDDMSESEGYTVSTGMIIGKTMDEWTASPLVSIDDYITLAESKEEYSWGEDVEFRIQMPTFDSGSIMVVWGSTENEMKKVIQPITAANPDNNKNAGKKKMDDNNNNKNTVVEKVAIPLGKECWSPGCEAIVIISIPRLNNYSLPIPIPTSPLVDLSQPRSIILRQTIRVKPDDHEPLDIQLTVADNSNSNIGDTEVVIIQEPGKNVSIEMEIIELSRRYETVEDIEVCIWVVDQAVLDLLPSPLPDFHISFAVGEFYQVIPPDDTSVSSFQLSPSIYNIGYLFLI